MQLAESLLLTIADAVWLLAINPTSGLGKGAVVSQQVANFLAERKIDYRIVTGSNALTFQENLRKESGSASGIIAVGGDGLLHMAIQVAAAAFITPYTGGLYVAPPSVK